MVEIRIACKIWLCMSYRNTFQTEVVGLKKIFGTKPISEKVFQLSHHLLTLFNALKVYFVFARLLMCFTMNPGFFEVLVDWHAVFELWMRHFGATPDSIILEEVYPDSSGRTDI